MITLLLLLMTKIKMIDINGPKRRTENMATFEEPL
jgi:hypothetical protein